MRCEAHALRFYHCKSTINVLFETSDEFQFDLLLVSHTEIFFKHYSNLFARKRFILQHTQTLWPIKSKPRPLFCRFICFTLSFKLNSISDTLKHYFLCFFHHFDYFRLRNFQLPRAFTIFFLSFVHYAYLLLWPNLMILLLSILPLAFFVVVLVFVNGFASF